MSYSPKNPKIDIFVNGKYECSTNWYKTCKEAKAHFLLKHDEATDGKVTVSKSK